ncbi:MAG: tetratricopeptide repeat protein [Anaerolineae bacterium]|nr:tetratricopeptide repeat protein [Anaerolineae bacterium]
MQNKPVDSLREQIDSLNQQAATLRFEKPQEALPLALEALKLAQNGTATQPAYTVGTAVSLTNLAFANNRLGNREQALAYALDALAYYEQDDDLCPTPTLYFTLGSIYMALSEYPESLTYYYQALDLAREQTDQQQARLMIGVDEAGQQRRAI